MFHKKIKKIKAIFEIIIHRTRSVQYTTESGDMKELTA